MTTCTREQLALVKIRRVIVRERGDIYVIYTFNMVHRWVAAACHSCPVAPVELHTRRSAALSAYKRNSSVISNFTPSSITDKKNTTYGNRKNIFLCDYSHGPWNDTQERIVTDPFLEPIVFFFASASRPPLSYNVTRLFIVLQELEKMDVIIPLNV